MRTPGEFVFTRLARRGAITNAMPPSLALLLWLILLIALLRFDPARDSNISLAVWIPVTWMFIVGTRLPSQWLGIQAGANALEEGSPVDSTVYSILILLSICVLASRSFKWIDFFSRNIALVAFLSFALLSICWSDFPFVTFKRWFRDSGNYLVMLVALSDPRPLEAVRTLLRRFCYLSIPLSVVLLKYFPQLSIYYSAWTGAPEYVGATLSKNMLGVLCLVSGIFFFWDTVTRWSKRKQGKTKRIILLNVGFIAMTLYLLHLSSSATSTLCLVLGCFVVAATHTKPVRRHPAFLKVLIPVGICIYLVLTYGLGIELNSMYAGAVGRDPTLTGRTVIWSAVLSTHTNPILGAGYDTFWLGPRLLQVWSQTGSGINEAHNGYLELYLNLGIVGVLLIVGFLISSYRSICKRLDTFSSLGSLSLALWTILPFYNVTEAAFKGQLIFVTFLLGAIIVPNSRRVSSTDKILSKEPSLKLREAISR
jgi:exopolysaccharide production protein ExoQ